MLVYLSFHEEEWTHLVISINTLLNAIHVLHNNRLQHIRSA